MEGSRVAKKEGGSKLPWIIAGSVAGVLAAAYLGITSALGIPVCPMVLFWGLPCPGCGMTRAALLFFKGKWNTAWQMHPFVFTLPVLAVLAFASRYAAGRDSKALKWTASAVLAVSIVFYVYRMLTVFPHRAPMLYEPGNGLGMLWNVCSRRFYGSCIIFLDMVN